MLTKTENKKIKIQIIYLLNNKKISFLLKRLFNWYFFQWKLKNNKNTLNFSFQLKKKITVITLLKTPHIHKKFFSHYKKISFKFYLKINGFWNEIKSFLLFCKKFIPFKYHILF